jgi:hypothetical protein
METDSWIERRIIQQLSYPNKRYKYNYEPKEGSTEQLIAECAHLKDITSEGQTTPLLQMHQLHEEIEEDVEETAKQLHEQGLLTKVGERPIRNELGGEQIGTTSVWEPTQKGLAEAQRLNEAYSEAIAELLEEYTDPEDLSVEEAKPILKRYGVVPDMLPREFFEKEDKL